MTKRSVYTTFFTVILAGIIVAMFASCTDDGAGPDKSVSKDPCRIITTEEFIPDPAVEYCVALGYTVELCTDSETGNGYTVVTFPDGTKCDPWEFFRGLKCREWTYCELQGYRLISIRENVGQMEVIYPVCIFKDFSECHEASYFRGDCGPGD